MWPTSPLVDPEPGRAVHPSSNARGDRGGAGRRRGRPRRRRSLRRAGGTAPDRGGHRHQRQVDHDGPVQHLLATAGVDAVRGGNIGEAVFDLDQGGPERVFVLELSSFQLDLAPTLRCAVSVWLNLTPDHLDRHGDLDGYIRAKSRIFEHQKPGDAAVIGVDDEPSREVARALREQGRQVIRVCVGSVPEGGVGVRDGVLVDALEGQGREVADLGPRQNLPGSHQPSERRCGLCRLPGTGSRRREGGARSAELRRAAAPAGAGGGNRMASASSTTARPPTPTLPPGRSIPFLTSSGSPAAGPSPEASPACGRISRACAAPS